MALQEDYNIGRITIVGGGTTGHFAALHLAKTFPDKQITWIYPEENEPIGVGESVVPEVSQFLENLGINHEDIIKNCNGTLKLGVLFEGFHTPDSAFTFPFGFTDNPNRSKSKYNTKCVELMMSTKKISKNLLEYPDISTHFNATKVVEYLAKTVNQYSNLTTIRKTVSKEELEGTYDLLVDCTGFKREISYMPDNFVSIQDRIPNNKALTFRHPYTDVENQRLPYTLIKAMDHGWIWHIPLGDHLAMGYVHDDKFDVREEYIKHIEDKFGVSIDPNAIGEVKMKTGRNKIHLQNKIVAVGLASSFIEPLESTGLYLMVAALRKLEFYIKGQLSEDEYNRLVNIDCDVIVDFIVAHYKYSDRTNEYWDHYKDQQIETYGKIDVFPREAWNFILSAFLKDIPRPNEPLDPQELINIAKGTPYQEWFNNVRTSTSI